MKNEFEWSAQFIVGLVFTLIGIPFLIVYTATHSFDIIFALIFGLLGSVFTVIGVVLLYLYFRKKKIQKRVTEEGNYILADVVEIRQDLHVSVNDAHPWIVECEWVNPDDGSRHVFRSKETMERPVLHEEQVRVYINPDNLDEYLVDLESAMDTVHYH